MKSFLLIIAMFKPFKQEGFKQEKESPQAPGAPQRFTTKLLRESPLSSMWLGGERCGLIFRKNR
jgi:hypothetical protein